MIEMEQGSDAFDILSEAFNNPNTYRVRINHYPAEDTPALESDRVSIKVNEGMWSPPLKTE